MELKVMLDPGAKMPTRAHSTDAGLDLYNGPHPVTVSPGTPVTINTGVHVEIPAGYVGMVKSKSGLMRDFQILTSGTIDAGFIGSIGVVLFNNGVYDVEFDPGEKIAQLVILPIVTPDLVQVDKLEETERGSNGFGSTGR